MPSPSLERCTSDGVTVYTDTALRERTGILVAFTERGGGVSERPYSSLDLAGHVGDDPASVDENRSRLLASVGLGHLRDRLTCAEQVHGDRIADVGEEDAGRGAFASGGRPAVPATDALLTSVRGIPLLLCFADCVPVVLVAEGGSPAVAVVHAGWRGALSRLPGKAALALAERTGRPASSLLAYVGPRVCEECYEVGEELRCRFEAEFGTMRAARGRLNLGAVVSGGLADVGVLPENVIELEACTATATDRFFSYRAEGVTGRHGAIAVIV